MGLKEVVGVEMEGDQSVGVTNIFEGSLCRRRRERVDDVLM